MIKGGICFLLVQEDVGEENVIVFLKFLLVPLVGTYSIYLCSNINLFAMMTATEIPDQSPMLSLTQSIREKIGQNLSFYLLGAIAVIWPICTFIIKSSRKPRNLQFLGGIDAAFC